MDSVKLTAEMNPLEPAKNRPVKDSGFSSAYKITGAETLLRETNQYPRWQALRQNNAAEAVKTADAVLKRHDILVKARKGEPVDWQAFDSLTQYAAGRGISLYKSQALFNVGLVADSTPLAEIPSVKEAYYPAVEKAPSVSQADTSMIQATSPATDKGPVISDDNLLVLNVTYNNHVLNNGMAGYGDEGKVFLPLDEMARTLDFNIDVDYKAGKAQGWFISEDRKLYLDLDKGQIVTDGREYDVPEGSIVAGEGDIFIDSKLMGVLFPVDFNTNFSEMSLEIEPREKIPFQEKLDREAKWNRINPYAETQPELPRRESRYKLFSTPFVDFTLRSDYSKNDRSTSAQGGYSILSKGDLGYMSSEVFISGDNKKSLQNFRIALERSDPNAGLLGPLKATNLALGDISTPSFPIIGGVRKETGVSVSNMELNRPSEFDTTNFNGTITPGWDVELYRNEILIETHRVRSDGRYSFEEVPVYFGSNDFKLVFYGPQGQKRVETKQINVGDQMLKQGKGAYQLAVSKKNDELWDPGNKPPKPDQGGLKAVAKYEAGLSKNISLSSGLSSEEVKDQRHNYINAGMRGSFSGFSLNSDYIHDTAGGDAVQVLGQTRLGPVSLRAKQEVFSNFTDPEDNLDPKTALTDISLNGTIPGNGTFPSLPFSLTYRDTKREFSHEKILGTRLSANFKNLNLNQYLEVKDDSKFGKASPEIKGYVQGTSQIGPLRTRGIVNYEIEPETEITGVGLSNLYRINDQLSSELILNHELQYTDTSKARLKLNWNNGKFILSPEIYADTQGNYGGLLSFNMSFGQEPRSGRIKASSNSIADTGGVSARVFNDKNLNGVFDKGDEPIKGAEVKAPQSHKKALTNDEGIAFLTGLTKYKPTDVNLNTDSLEDPFQEPLAKGNSIVPRPGHVDLMEIPVVTTGEVDGTIFKEGTDGVRIPLANRTIQLLDPEGKVTDEVRSEYDGFYLFMKVKPGQYTVRIKPDDEPGKGYIPSSGSVSAPIKIGKDGTVASGNDILFKISEEKETRVAKASINTKPGTLAPMGEKATAADHTFSRDLSLANESKGIAKTVETPHLRFLPPEKEKTGPVHETAKDNNIAIVKEDLRVEKTAFIPPADEKSQKSDYQQKYGLHLTSYRTPQKAVQGIGFLRNKYQTLLGKTDFSVKPVDLGPEKGKWYRVIAGSFGTLKETEALGNRIKMQSPYCRVVSTGDNTGVHLTSFRTEKKAAESIKELKAQYPNILGNISFSIQDEDLGPEKGKWKRVIAGNFQDREEAKALAQKIKRIKPYAMPVGVEKKSSTGIHLASFRTSKKADEALEKLHKKFPGLVADKSLFIRQVDLGTKGTWYRVIAGSFENREDADSTIRNLISRNQYAAPVKLL